MFSYVTIKEHPKLEGQFVERVQKALKYASSIDDFDELVDPRTLARLCLGSEPSLFVLHAIRREEKSKSFWDESGLSFFSCLLLLNMSVVFFSCKDDDKIQPGIVCPDEGKKERTPLQYWLKEAKGR